MQAPVGDLRIQTSIAIASCIVRHFVRASNPSRNHAVAATTYHVPKDSPTNGSNERMKSPLGAIKRADVRHDLLQCLESEVIKFFPSIATVVAHRL